MAELSAFGRAFAEARKRGDKVFSFQGKSYTTELAKAAAPAPKSKPEPEAPPEPKEKPRPSLGEAMRNVEYSKDGATEVVEALKANTKEDPEANAEATKPAREMIERDRKKFGRLFIGK